VGGGERDGEKGGRSHLSSSLPLEQSKLSKQRDWQLSKGNANPLKAVPRRESNMVGSKVSSFDTDENARF